MCEAVGAQEVRGGIGREDSQGVFAFDPVLSQEVGATGVGRDRAVGGRAEEEIADVRVGGQGGDEVRMPLLDLLSGQAMVRPP